MSRSSSSAPFDERNSTNPPVSRVTRNTQNQQQQDSHSQQQSAPRSLHQAYNQNPQQSYYQMPPATPQTMPDFAQTSIQSTIPVQPATANPHTQFVLQSAQGSGQVAPRVAQTHPYDLCPPTPLALKAMDAIVAAICATECDLSIPLLEVTKDMLQYLCTYPQLCGVWMYSVRPRYQAALAGRHDWLRQNALETNQQIVPQASHPSVTFTDENLRNYQNQQQQYSQNQRQQTLPERSGLSIQNNSALRPAPIGAPDVPNAREVKAQRTVDSILRRAYATQDDPSTHLVELDAEMHAFFCEYPEVQRRWLTHVRPIYDRALATRQDWLRRGALERHQ